jgi:cytochrome b6-f complex iron-sulfur subunit
MKRQDFIKTLAAGSVGAVVLACAGGCSNDTTVSGPATNVDFTLDLNDSANSALKTSGGYIYSNNIIITNQNGTYVALSQACTHENGQVAYQSASNNYRCPLHSAIFSANGAHVSGPGSAALRKFNTTLTGTKLRITS